MTLVSSTTEFDKPTRYKQSLSPLPQIDKADLILRLMKQNEKHGTNLHEFFSAFQGKTFVKVECNRYI